MRIPHNIGTIASDGKLDLPEDAITQGFAILAKRGKGKTNLAASMEEIFLASGQPIVVLDPPAAHWGIRYAADEEGKPSGPSGFDVLIIGGEHGDIPLEQTDGREAARMIVDGDISCVIDMRALSFTGRQKWCAEFADEIFKINKTPRHIFFEEAQNFLPQVLKFDEQKAVLYAMSRIIEEGRSSGLGFTIISQRPAKINKDALTQIDNLLVLGMMGPQDLDQVEEWFKHHFDDKEQLRAMIDTLPKLTAGYGWALMPEHLKEPAAFKARLRVTYHAGRTPKPGEHPANVSKFSISEAVEKLKAQFAEKQKERRQEVADLNEAKKRIRELERELKSKPSVTKEVRVSDEKAIARAVLNATKQYREMLSQQSRAFREIANYLERSSIIAQREAARQLPQVPGGEIQQRGEGRLTVPEAPKPKPIHRRPIEVHAENNGTITGPMRKILTALAELRSIGKEVAPKEMVAAWAGYSPNGGAFSNPLGTLRTCGYISYPQGGTVALTDEGLTAIGGDLPAPDQDEINRRILAILDGPKRKILAALMDHGNEAISKTQLAEESGYSEGGGAFSNPLGALRTAGFIEYPQSGHVRCADWLFL